MGPLERFEMEEMLAELTPPELKNPVLIREVDIYMGMSDCQMGTKFNDLPLREQARILERAERIYKPPPN